MRARLLPLLLGAAVLALGSSQAIARGHHGSFSGRSTITTSNRFGVSRFQPLLARPNFAFGTFNSGFRDGRFRFERFDRRFDRFEDRFERRFDRRRFRDFGLFFPGDFFGDGFGGPYPQGETAPIVIVNAGEPGAFAGAASAGAASPEEDRASVETTPQGVTIVRGPGSHRLFR